jgi:ATP-dependent metalloprotease FtsH
MDGFATTDGILVLGATNRPNLLDPALLRPGRFDRSVGLSLPDEEGRLTILGVHAKGKVLVPGADLPEIARKSIGLTGADLANLLNEAALLAARAGRTAVGQDDLDESLSRTLKAPEQQRRLSMRERSIGKRFSETDEGRVTFADVAGQEEAITELKEIRDFLVTPERYSAVGAAIPRGVLLFGPPGCGKTMLAKALAAEANAAFISVSASEFVEVWVGQGASRMRDLFAEAKSMSPAIVFIDELDSVGGARGGTGRVQSHSERDQTLNQLLTEMDGFVPTDGIIVLGATNRPDSLDQALLRPGRFDRTIGLALPDEADRLAILKVHAKDKVLDTTAELAPLASRGIGLTGADLAGVMNEAALLAARAERPSISQDDLDRALQKLLEAPEKQRRLSLRGRSIGKRSASNERVTFSDVAGVGNAIDELREVRDYLADPTRFSAIGARPPRGILLSGPPGCGKTLLARAVAGEANAAFFFVAATEFVEVYVGEGAARVRDLFAEAKSMAPAIIFIDELDAVGGRRSSFNSSGTREHDQTLNQILVELDGFEATTALTVLAATNRPDMLDSALVRPGRFDRRVEITLPDRQGRRDILDIYARKKQLAADVDLDAVAGLTPGFSGAELENLLNEAALLASRRNLLKVPMTLLDEAIERVTIGLQSSGSLMTADERRVVAFHESGHALVGLKLPDALPPHKLTIAARGNSLGHSTHLGKTDRLMLSRSMCIDEMAVMLGGRIAEEVTFGEFGSGCASDFTEVERIARRMVCEFGMSSLGASVLSGGVNYRYSEDTTRRIDGEVRALIEEATDRARSVLDGDGAAVLERVAATLLERETLTGVELEALAEGKTLPSLEEPPPGEPEMASAADAGRRP